ERERRKGPAAMDQESSMGAGHLQEEEAPAAMAKSAKRRGKQQRREGGGARKRRQQQQEYRLVSYEELPEYMKENEFILNHYRSEWPLLHAFLSVFSWHNETINIWTHLLGFFLFLGLTLWHLAQYFPQVAHLIGHLSHLQGCRERLQQHRRCPLRRGVVHAGEPGAGDGGGGGGGADDAVALLRVPGGGHVLPDEQLRVPPAVLPLAPPQPLPHPPRLHRHRRHDRRLLLPAHLLHLPVRAALAARLPLRHLARRRRHRLRAHVAPPQRRQVPRPPRAALRRDGPVGRGAGRARRRGELARAAPERHAGVRGRHGRLVPRRHRVLPHPRARAVEARDVRPVRPEPSDIPPACHRRRARALRRRHRLPQGP
uniref:Uncharacterized protein n=1 Tax=Aegilops tauschii subsp. strangulata TaxID=200361 RepID=A0A453T6V5_AEGTS